VSDRNRTLVCAGLIVRDGRVLITQRTAEQKQPELALKWEFPGGKLEPGESPAEALVRELREEIGVTVRVGRIWDVLFHPYPTFDLVMLVYSCTILDGEPAAVEVNATAWVPTEELGRWDILMADRPLVERLLTEGPP
jgi:8-oxo-dGTP diphosphatase